MKHLWTSAKIKLGFEKFYKENGRLPTAPEIDKCTYLPSSRQIQRRFGGLEKLRKELGYAETHFGRGVYRKSISHRVVKKGRDVEIELERRLCNKFHEVFVHTEKIFDKSKNRVDFYIYSPDGNFGIDIFYTETMQDLQKNINLKIDRYKNFRELLFFVVANLIFKQKDLDHYSLSKKKILLPNMKILTLNELLVVINNKQSYQDPLQNA